MSHRLLTLLFIVLAAACTVFAQPDPNHPQPEPPRKPAPGQPALPPGGRNTIVEATPNGLFVFQSGVVAKFDATTLKPLGTLQLFGPMPAPPAMPDTPTPQDQQALMKWKLEAMRRMAAASMLVKDNLLLIVTADTFFRVNQRVMGIEAKISLTDIGDEKPNPSAWMTPMTLTLQDNMLYILRANQLTALNINNGEITGHGDLPREMMPITPPAVPDKRTDKPAGDTPREITVVGVLHHVALEGGLLALRSVEGDEYVLEGKVIADFSAKQAVEGARARVTGIFSQHPGVAQYGKGYLEVERIQLLPDLNEPAPK